MSVHLHYSSNSWDALLAQTQTFHLLKTQLKSRKRDNYKLKILCELSAGDWTNHTLVAIEELVRYLSACKAKHKLQDLCYAEMELTKNTFSIAIYKVLCWVKVWTTVHQHWWKIWVLQGHLSTESLLCSSFTTTGTHTPVNRGLQFTVAIHSVFCNLNYVFFIASSHILSLGNTIWLNLSQPSRSLYSAIQVHAMEVSQNK